MYTPVFVAACKNYQQHHMGRWAASVTYFIVLALAPLMLLITSVIEFLLRTQDAKQQLLHQVAQVAPVSVLPTIELILNQTTAQTFSGYSIAFSIILLGVVASSMVLALQDALHIIWGVRPIGGLKQSVYKKFRGVGMVLLVVILITLLSSISIIADVVQPIVKVPELLWQFGHICLVLAAMLYMCTVLIRTLAGVRVPWAMAWRAAIVITVLFLVGQLIISAYVQFGTQTVSGIVGAIVILLLWLYYSVQAFFFGVELIAAYMQQHNIPIEPTKEYELIEVQSKPTPSAGKRLLHRFFKRSTSPHS